MDRAQAEEIRKRNLARVAEIGLQAADSLPLADERGRLRDSAEIARRLMGMHAVVAWACAPEEAASSAVIQEYIATNELLPLLTDKEQEIVGTDRAAANEFCEKVGWNTENMWALAWVLGFEVTPRIDGREIDRDVARPLNLDFLELFNNTVASLLEKHSVRPADEVIELDDLFYCAHNAYRTVVLNGEMDWLACGVIQERRHALTWSLSPGVAWDETDLST